MTPSSKNERCGGSGYYCSPSSREGAYTHDCKNNGHLCPGCPNCRPKDFCGECKLEKCEFCKPGQPCYHATGRCKDREHLHCHGHQPKEDKPKVEKCPLCKRETCDPKEGCFHEHPNFKEYKDEFCHGFCQPTPPTNDQMAREAVEKVAERNHYPVEAILADEMALEIIKEVVAILTTKDRQCKERVERVVTDLREAILQAGSKMANDTKNKGEYRAGLGMGLGEALIAFDTAARRAAGEGEGV